MWGGVCSIFTFSLNECILFTSLGDEAGEHMWVGLILFMDAQHGNN